ncbi:hypothetical protein [Nonomuraea sp. NPDC046570]|uniref:aldose epimerase family protein n=1 Tax=Nonomuraea sp. NPDC046570 TaxID=3155255 RepID=UPI0033C87090
MTATEPATIAWGGTRATIDPIGATLTGLRLGDESILAGPGRVAPELGHHGAVLTPWPNRLANGRYEFAGRAYQLPINDPAYGHALHGLAFDQLWALERRSASSVSFGRVVGGVDGYPFLVRVTVTYTVTATGLRCDAAWVNIGDQIAPFGIGFHPYFRPGPSPLTDWILKLTAPSYLETDPLSALPTRRRLVDNSGFDFREGRALGPDRFSVAYAVAPTEDAGDITLSDPAGLTLTIRTSPAFRWIQVFSGDLPSKHLTRTGVGIEPQTCPPNALATGTDLIVLQPGESGSAAWSVDGAPSD